MDTPGSHHFYTRRLCADSKGETIIELDLPIKLPVYMDRLANVTDAQRTVLTAYASGLSFARMTKALGCHPSAVASCFRRGAHRLGTRGRANTRLVVTYLMDEGLW